MSPIKKKIHELPHSPGVYLMKAGDGEILYIGKATDLRQRVRSYLSPEQDSRYQIRFLMAKVADLDFIVTDNAKEALLLEATLIRQHHPRYNLDLKDDKSYVSIKLSLGDPAPRLYITRRIKKDGSVYFGPYASAGACREVVDFLQQHFRLRNCSDHDYRNRSRPCLQYQIKRCDAPCVGYIGLPDYREIVTQVQLFLEGKSVELKTRIESSMAVAAEAEDFEQAARWRNLLWGIDKLLQKQRVFSHRSLSRDVIGCYRDQDRHQLLIMMIREGKLVDKYSLQLSSWLSPGDFWSDFLLQYYENPALIPPEILLPEAVPEIASLAEILGERRGQRCQISLPKRGERRALLRLAQRNAEELYQQEIRKNDAQLSALHKLKALLDLKEIPERIECYDISHFQGQETLGAMVVLLHGQPAPDQYRRFNIERLKIPNDFASMYEVLQRRFARSRSGDWPWPDLIVIDGGKGQLSSAVKARDDLGIRPIPMVALAKSRILENQSRSSERIFLPGRKDAVALREQDPASRLLILARNEAHRFGITAHRRKLKQRSLATELRRVPGIGERRAQQLMQHFGSVASVQRATVAAVAEALKLKESSARKLHEQLQGYFQNTFVEPSELASKPSS